MYERRRLKLFGALALLTTAPLLLLSLSEGLAFGPRVEVPILRDPGFYCRYLAALPLLVGAEIFVGMSLAVQVGYLLESGLVPEEERPSFQAAKAQLQRLARSRAAKVVAGALAFVVVTTFRLLLDTKPGASSWERLGAADGGRITLAGWWSILVSVPVLVGLLLHWLWRAGVWAWFLFRVSRLDLALTPTHPDRAGGLGFLAWGQASFAPVLAAVSAVLSGSIAGEVLYGGRTVDALKYHAVVFVVLALAFLLAPLLVFSRRMAHCRFQAILDFGMLVWRHDRAFDEKWIRNLGTSRESLLGSPDVSSLSDIGVAFDHVERMRIMPLDHQALLVLLMAAVAPLLPSLATAIPLPEILKNLAGFLV
ncbi:hypothetical protein [Paludisphaera mucosa]|uniref:Uncharacterized protein n=1 Tax=Paludisphaera mucosa TaxID=3030827 RepID=A0ABT6FI84_9BACT|nr:hypothetical protein [Paludisphaera mucosa]MDG3007105.1 hypothetical protein [Paludisphaera mucosa]